MNIENQLKAFSDSISEKTINHAIEIFSKCGKDGYFGRTIVEEITGLKPSGASKLIKLLSESKDEGALDRRMAVRADHFKNVKSVKDRGGSEIR
ncbi:MAG: hypothetical protein MJ161_07090 [Clostridia bacterium]|nr:hypothetical protein [Clostridia bacterium]